LHWHTKKPRQTGPGRHAHDCPILGRQGVYRVPTHRARAARSSGRPREGEVTSAADQVDQLDQLEGTVLEPACSLRRGLLVADDNPDIGRQLPVENLCHQLRIFGADPERLEL
jgi:hypothetical protein